MAHALPWNWLVVSHCFRKKNSDFFPWPSGWLLACLSSRCILSPYLVPAPGALSFFPQAQSKLVPASGPLHMPFLLPCILFPDIHLTPLVSSVSETAFHGPCPGGTCVSRGPLAFSDDLRPVQGFQVCICSTLTVASSFIWPRKDIKKKKYTIIHCAITLKKRHFSSWDLITGGKTVFQIE